MSPLSGCSIIIPARGGSVRVPNKNLQMIDGETLVERTLNFAKKLGPEKIVVSSDDAEILSSVPSSANVEANHRHESLSGPETPTIQVAHHLCESGVVSSQLVLVLQPTSPFRKRETVFEAYRQARSSRKNIVAVSPYRHAHPFWALEQDASGSIRFPGSSPFQLQSQDLPPRFFLNGNFYFYHQEHLLNHTITSSTTEGFCCDDEYESLDIDTQFDLFVAQSLSSSFKKS